jgi:hypothetical protein
MIAVEEFYQDLVQLTFVENQHVGTTIRFSAPVVPEN